MSVQISAYISDEVKERFERYSAEHGVKKAYLIERALDYYLSALEEIPAQFFDDKRVEVSSASLKKAIESEESEPTAALRTLMSDD